MKIRKTFAQYVIPSVLAFALSGIYAIVDGFFVGQSVGDVGLSAINMAFPIVSLIQALGTGIGMGGAVLWSIRRASDETAAARYVRASFWLLFCASTCTTLLFFAIEPILLVFGAEGTVFALGKDYLKVIVLGAVFQIFATGAVPLIRNAGGSLFSFITMMLGFATNILLDYVMIWVLKMNTTGAAIATVIGQAVTALAAMVWLLLKKVPLFGKSGAFGHCAASILRIGIAPFGLTLSPMLSLMLINRFCMAYGGDLSVACYACIAYAIAVVQMLLQGVGDGCQPLISQSYGKGDKKEENVERNLAYGVAAALAFLCCIPLFVLRKKIGPLFGASEIVSAEVAAILPAFLLGLIFYAYSRISTALFYATEQTMRSYLCVYAEPALLLLLLCILPLFWQQTGVWRSAVLSQILTAVIAFLLMLFPRKKKPPFTAAE